MCRPRDSPALPRFSGLSRCENPNPKISNSKPPNIKYQTPKLRTTNPKRQTLNPNPTPQTPSLELNLKPQTTNPEP